MIRYYCDNCKKTIDTRQEVRYVVNLQVIAAFDPSSDLQQPDDAQRDYIEEINEILDHLDAPEDDLQLIDKELHQEMRFDLCDHCRRRFLADPLGREAKKRMKFSPN